MSGTKSSVSGHQVSDHFADVRKMVGLGSGSQREIEDVKATNVVAGSMSGAL